MYEPKIDVVRRSPLHDRRWVMEDGLYPDSMERAYLVRGLPMPGEWVVASDDGRVYTVLGLDHRDIMIALADGSYITPDSLRPYDPEDERLRVATEAVKTRAGQWWVLTTTEAEVIARAVLDAIKEVDDG